MKHRRMKKSVFLSNLHLCGAIHSFIAEMHLQYFLAAMLTNMYYDYWAYVACIILDYHS